MKALPALLLVFALSPALAQPGPGRPYGPYAPYGQGQGYHSQRDFQRQMPPPDRRMSGDERQRLREQVRGGQMSRDEARERWREERARRGVEPVRSPQDRERLRRDVLEANCDYQRR